MNTFKYLYKNRERPTTLKRSIVLLAKRALMLRPLIKILRKQKGLINKGAQVGALTIIGDAKIEGRNLENLAIGDEVSIGRVHIALHDKVIIGDRVVLNDGVTLLTASHHLSDPKWGHKPALIKIDDYAWIATNSIILPGVTIGRGAVVGAGSVVRNDVPDYGVVFGNPAQLVENRSRTTDLDYSPVLFNAPFEAWLGKKYE